MTTVDVIMRRMGDIGITDSINIARTDDGWQVSVKRPKTNSYKIGIAKHMDEAFRKAASPPYGTPIEEWLDLENDDDWADLI